jgi:hypothetical protein
MGNNNLKREIYVNNYAENSEIYRGELKNNILSIIIDYEIIIKISLIVFLILLYYFNVFTLDNQIFSSSTKLYIGFLLFIIIYIINASSIITLLKLLVLVIFLIIILGIIYFNIEKLQFIILFYYSFNYQLEKIYNNTSANYSEVIFSFIYISIISILSIVLYWDNIYTDSKKLSKCGTLINIIEDNNKKKNPFVYNIIIMNNDLINTSTSHYVLKIVFDFIKNKTTVDFGTDNGTYEDGVVSFKKPDYASLLKTNRENLEQINKELVKINEMPDSTTDKTEKKEKKEEEKVSIEGKIKELEKLRDNSIKDSAFFYLNLKTMKSEKIENIDPDIINTETYKYLLVDEYNKKIPYDKTSKELIKFTKNYSNNEFYNMNVINDIIYAKNNRNKLLI